jgi:hypothetical protein
MRRPAIYFENKIRDYLKTQCPRTPEGNILRSLIGMKEVPISELEYWFTQHMPEVKLGLNELYKK